jgi:hypothetical protein
MRIPRLLLSSFIVCSFCFCNLVFAGGVHVEVYALRHQTPEALVPAIESTLKAGESVQPFNNELVVNASSASHDQVQQLITQLDRAMRNLMISVQDNNTRDSVSNDTGVSGGIRTGDVYLGTGQPIVRERGLVVQHEGLQVHTNRVERNSTTQSSQQVRAIEGHPSWISAGQSAPVRSYDRYGNMTAQYVDANQGFYVTARLVGERVLLDISTTNDSFANTRRGVINTQRVRTTVSGRIGDWIELGTIQTANDNHEQGYTSRENNTGNSISGISVRVVPAD